MIMKGTACVARFRVILVLFIFIVFVSLSGCGGVNEPFTLMDENYKMRPGSVAVVSGSNDEPGVKLAAYLTRELRQRSNFRVMRQQTIMKRMPNYPFTIKTKRPKDEQKPVWFAPSEKRTIRAIQKRLKTDYLLIVWVTDLSRQTVTYSHGGGKTTYYSTIVGNFMKKPKSNPIAYTHFTNAKGRSCFLFASEGEDLDALFRNSAEKIASRFLSAAGPLSIK